jgi:hypothetical protein
VNCWIGGSREFQNPAWEPGNNRENDREETENADRMMRP